MSSSDNQNRISPEASEVTQEEASQLEERARKAEREVEQLKASMLLQESSLRKGGKKKRTSERKEGKRLPTSASFDPQSLLSPSLSGEKKKTRLPDESSASGNTLLAFTGEDNSNTSGSSPPVDPTPTTLEEVQSKLTTLSVAETNEAPKKKTVVFNENLICRPCSPPISNANVTLTDVTNNDNGTTSSNTSNTNRRIIEKGSLIPEDFQFGSKLSFKTPKKIQHSLNKGTAPKEVVDMVHKCNGKPIKQLPNFRPHSCAYAGCNKTTNWYCPGCKRWLCMHRNIKKNQPLSDLMKKVFKLNIKGKEVEFQAACFHLTHMDNWMEEKNNSNNENLQFLRNHGTGGGARHEMNPSVVDHHPQRNLMYGAATMNYGGGLQTNQTTNSVQHYMY